MNDRNCPMTKDDDEFIGVWNCNRMGQDLGQVC